MPSITDPILSQIFATCAYPDLPQPVVAGAHWLIHLLLASRSWATLGAIAEIYALGDDRYAAVFDQHWAISFAWDATASRVCEARLEAL
ncbi:hypothetical protein [Sphingomonas crocodyli]|uniref:Uncharacterized protein n=1 Tax=Sphingomonas crocodyli TaxID=1979270 RepID=A0A437M7D5_9SPHN|nr:hypothetical protein [Sphingomonas crocodyli]RVT93445.1 hypothetical protein EOD43_06100 [Sphingomonas crocodyli]